MRIQIDGEVRTATKPNGQEMTVDSRQYLKISGLGFLVLVTPDRQLVLGKFRDIIAERPFKYDRGMFSADKQKLIDEGIGAFMLAAILS